MIVGTVFLGLSKAFDLVSHDILIAKLAKYHTRQVCSVSGVLSSPPRLEKGVPRGSILGPHLFSVYMNDLPLLLKEIEVDIYADDTTFGQVELPALKYKLKMRVQAKRTAGLNSMKCKLTLKRRSTYSLALLRSSITVKKTTLELSIDNTRLKQSVGEKLLGVVTDLNLSWDLHVDYLIKKTDL